MTKNKNLNLKLLAACWSVQLKHFSSFQSSWSGLCFLNAFIAAIHCKSWNVRIFPHFHTNVLLMTNEFHFSRFGYLFVYLLLFMKWNVDAKRLKSFCQKNRKAKLHLLSFKLHMKSWRHYKWWRLSKLRSTLNFSHCNFWCLMHKLYEKKFEQVDPQMQHG